MRALTEIARAYNNTPVHAHVMLDKISGVQVTTRRQTRDGEPMLFQYWSTVSDAGPTLKQQWPSNIWPTLVQYLVLAGLDLS